MSSSTDPVAEPQICAGWAEIVGHLEAFAPPTLGFDDEGEVTSHGWAFRGLTDASYRLEPAIEREARAHAAPWAALELLVANEFRARAHMHLGPAALPRDGLTWLALMQHYGVPTRLLDFTYSPFVALYFAIRNNKGTSGAIRLWAIDAQAVNDAFRSVARRAQVEEEDKQRRGAGLPPASRAVNFGDADSFYTPRDSVEHETQTLEGVITAALAAKGARRRVQEKEGCVCAAAPPSFNPRLASQQGVFLVNCAEDMTFGTSLTRMMAAKHDWFRAFDIPAAAVPEIEAHLFQLNIHEQSLFPDMEGLAGFIRQKIRLHWK